MPDRIESFKVVCSGGLNSNENHLDLSDNSPGSATRLVNYEPSLYGGYRRIDGFQPLNGDYPEVGTNAVNVTPPCEGGVLGLALFKDTANNQTYTIAARKDTGGATYSFWRDDGLSGWTKLTPGFSLNTTSGSKTISRVRSVQFNFGSGNNIVFVDNINYATVFDGTSWYQIQSGNTGGTASPGGDQAVDAPAIVDVFQNHLFLGGDAGNRSVICHSAPNDPLNFTVAAGAGQIATGFDVVQFKPFRDQFFVFSVNGIKKVTVDGSLNFVLTQVTANVGCIARDSVVEIGGDLLFLSPDGLRPVAGTSRIGDVELETVSKSIQGRVVDIIQNYDLDTLCSLVIRSKSQVRYFVGDTADTTGSSIGIIGGLTTVGGSIRWEFGELIGIRASATASEYVGREEFILHGDYDGNVYRQEQGISFNGSDITAVYTTPYLDFGETEIRKVLRKVNTFVRAEGPVTLNLSVNYDWGDPAAVTPSSYSAESAGAPTVYGGRNIKYAGANVLYGGSDKPIITNDIQGSGYSMRLTYVSTGQFYPYSIQGFVIEFSIAGRR